MKKSVKIVLIIIMLILENVALLYIANLYQQHKTYKELTEANNGLNHTCKELVISDSLSSVLQKMKKFAPTVYLVSNNIYLYYGIEQPESGGVAVLFDSNYKLSHKECNAKWEPDTPSFPINFQ